VDAAFKITNRALAHACTHREPGHQAYALRLFGEIVAHHDPGNIEQAEAHYHQALTLAEAMMMRPLQAHCHFGLGKLYSQRGQVAQARSALSTAIDLYQSMEMTYWLPQGEAALAEVGNR
jgi:Flp pilus assembly protein TadD